MNESELYIRAMEREINRNIDQGYYYKARDQLVKLIAYVERRE